MKKAIVALCLIFAGSAFADEHTVAENDALSRAVEQRMSPQLARIIMETPYDAFYKISGSMRRGGDYRFNRVRDAQSFPDNRWEKQAIDVTNRIEFSGDVRMIGTRLKPKATAYVVMYKGGLNGVKHTGDGESLALVMIDQENAYDASTLSTNISGQALYLMDLSMN